MGDLGVHSIGLERLLGAQVGANTRVEDRVGVAEAAEHTDAWRTTRQRHHHPQAVSRAREAGECTDCTRQRQCVIALQLRYVVWSKRHLQRSLRPRTVHQLEQQALPSADRRLTLGPGQHQALEQRRRVTSARAEARAQIVVECLQQRHLECYLTVLVPLDERFAEALELGRLPRRDDPAQQLDPTQNVVHD